MRTTVDAIVRDDEAEIKAAVAEYERDNGAEEGWAMLDFDALVKGTKHEHRDWKDTPWARLRATLAALETEYKSVKDPAWAELEAVADAALAELEAAGMSKLEVVLVAAGVVSEATGAKHKAALAKYKAVVDPAGAKYHAAVNPAEDKYYADKMAAEAKYWAAKKETR
jgi:hypothetical protein